MKFKFKVNTGDLLSKINPEMAETMPANVAIDVETECTLEELKGLYSMQKDFIKEAPLLFKGFFDDCTETMDSIKKFESNALKEKEVASTDSTSEQTVVS